MKILQQFKALSETRKRIVLSAIVGLLTGSISGTWASGFMALFIPFFFATGVFFVNFKCYKPVENLGTSLLVVSYASFGASLLFLLLFSGGFQLNKVVTSSSDFGVIAAIGAIGFTVGNSLISKSKKWIIVAPTFAAIAAIIASWLNFLFPIQEMFGVHKPVVFFAIWQAGVAAATAYVLEPKQEAVNKIREDKKAS